MTKINNDKLNEIKEVFANELKGANTIEELREIYKIELNKRDKLINELRNQNKILLQTAFKQHSQRQ